MLQPLSDVELALLRFFDDATAGPPDQWPSVWEANGLQDDKQVGMTALRYSLAHMGYAAAALVYARMPAYTEPATRILLNIFKRMLQPRVWRYWTRQGTCGAPFKTNCKRHNRSMADEQKLEYTWQPSAELDDPVGTANIMYSAHLAHIGLLYESLSGDASLSTVGWWFESSSTSSSRPRNATSNLHYNLDTLVEALSRLASSNTAAGFGATCEPGSVFPSCNGHVHAALRLHTAVRNGTAPAEIATSLTRGWIKWAYDGGGVLWEDPNLPTHNHCLFKIVRLKEHTPTPEVGMGLPACASHDAWTLAYLRTYMPLPPVGTEQDDVQVRGVRTLATAPVWEPARHGAYLNSHCLMQGDSPFYKPLGTSFFSVAIAQLPPALLAAAALDQQSWVATALARDEQARAYIDSYGVAVGRRSYFYNASYGMALITTANRAMVMALTGQPTLLWEMGRASRAGRAEPYVARLAASYGRVGSHGRVVVRAARFLGAERSLSLTLQPDHDEPDHDEPDHEPGMSVDSAVAAGVAGTVQQRAAGEAGAVQQRVEASNCAGADPCWRSGVNATLTIALLGGYRFRDVLINGSFAGGWSANTYQVVGTVQLVEGLTDVQVRMA